VTQARLATMSDEQNNNGKLTRDDGEHSDKHGSHLRERERERNQAPFLQIKKKKMNKRLFLIK
jgi:hypothetical protein